MQRYLITSLFIALISGCSTIDNNIDFLSVHKIDVQQGNIITDEMIDLLRPGLTEGQVQYVMGTPLITDTFNPNHWDYVYVYRHGDGQVEERKLRVVFKQGLVSAIEQ
ncbi:MAG: outer membrane protein assembly factor BamE [Oceanospirillaceae bacterium]|nr:outer membrane protein assembly factor BamE [Oceanospirillaceae bacterium]